MSANATFATPPVLKGPRGDILANCTPQRKFICVAPKLPSGTYSVLWDKEQPPEPTFGVKSTASGTFVYKDELETGAVFSARSSAATRTATARPRSSRSSTLAPGIVLGNLNVRAHLAGAGRHLLGRTVTNYDSGHRHSLRQRRLAPVKRRFMARVFDKAGNSNLSNPILALQFFVAKIAIESFTVSPSSVQYPGGPVTLSWSQKGATRLASTTAAAPSPCPTTRSPRPRLDDGERHRHDDLHADRDTSDAHDEDGDRHGHARRRRDAAERHPRGEPAPGGRARLDHAHRDGERQRRRHQGRVLPRRDADRHRHHRAVHADGELHARRHRQRRLHRQGLRRGEQQHDERGRQRDGEPDTTPPTVSLLANPATVLVPGSTTLQATASDNIGVTKVEFWRGATLIATDTAAPFQTQVDFTAADLGTATFTAKAFDAQNNNTTSAAVNVLVTTPSTGDTYASPTRQSTGNTTCAQANPCRSIAQAAATAQANKTVWLMNGVYTARPSRRRSRFPPG